MTGYLWPIILQLIGVAVVIAEIVLPSGGLLSLLAAGVFGYSLFLVFTELSATAGIVFVLVDIVTLPLLIVVGLKLLARSPATLSTELSSRSGVTSQPAELSLYLGREGRAITALRPAGSALIDGKRLDVVSRGEYIEKDAGLLVVDVSGNRIVVRKK
ncbi:MAG: NfeD family protein [Thermodesulfobacteriota bacterium]